MNPKSGIWTTEHFAAVVSQVLTLLALFGFISQNDTQTLEEAITKAIAAVFIFSANAAVVVHYIKSRWHLKANGLGDSGLARPEGVARPEQDAKGVAGKSIGLGLLVVTALMLFCGPARAQYLLPFRNNHEQRLKQMEQRLGNSQQPAPAPQAPAQPIFIHVPAPTAPQIIYQPAPAQPPLQSLPIQGQPLQTFPIQGQPLQPFPIQGQPLQPYPIQGQPQQALPVPGQPKQVFPMTPQSPDGQSPAPAPQAPTPPGPGQPQQSFPSAPPTPAQPPPTPTAPSRPPTDIRPQNGPVPYSSLIVYALH
jgi:hypothetical protein